VYSRCVEGPEPLLKRYNVTAARDAVVDLWGREALADVYARMPQAEREYLMAPMPAWVPVRVPVALSFAVYEGPVGRDKAKFYKFLHRHTDNSVGRVRKLLLGLANPERIFAEAPKMWRSEHTVGSLEARIDGKSGMAILRDHPYVESPHGRAAIAETFRYLVELSRAKDVTETHALVGTSAVEVKLRWK